MRSTYARLAVAAFAGLLVLSASAPQASGRSVPRPVRIDLSAAAHPHPVSLPVRDAAYRVDAVDGAPIHATTTATASGVCDGCSGQASAVQVLYLHRSPAMTLDNLAVAWDQQCTWCRATAVSLQVVVLSRPGILVPGNRALALDAACRRCAARSAAYQVVVSGTAGARLSTMALGRLRQWAADQVAALSLPLSPALRRSPATQHHGVRGVARLVNADLGSTTVSARARVSLR
jgi:hypothetical protein